jgi:septal ring factor EnvC (AmiA/AmiB activator)
MKTLTLILLAVLVFLLAFAVCIGLGYLGVNPFDTFKSTVFGAVSNVDVSSIVSNPTTLLAGVGSAVAVGVPLYTMAKSAQTKAAAAVNTAKTEVSNVTGQLNDANSKITSTELNLQSAEARIVELENSKKGVDATIASLTKQKDDALTQLTALNNIQARANVLADNKEVVRTIVK